jgi:NitT/TauT family transport system ATP-binding protein
VRAEINSHQFGLHSAGGAEFQAAAGRIHDLLFGHGDVAEDSARAVRS